MDFKLRSGVRIADPIGLVHDFIKRDGTYQTYDLAPVLQDGILTEADVRIANRMIARMPMRVIAGIMARADRINGAISSLPSDASLVEPTASVPWNDLKTLFDAFQGVAEVGLPRITKVLHKKRPALIPILDSVVEAYLVAVDGQVSGSLSERGVALMRAYKREMDHLRGPLAEIRSVLNEANINLTETRLLDIFLWAYSGQYEPLWRRTDRATPPQRMPRGTAPLPSDPRVTVFSGLVRPDGIGVLDNGRERVRFAVELDRGTENGTRLEEKLGGYARVSRFRDAPKLLIFIFHSERREAEARRHLHNAGMTVATTTLSTAMADPLGAIWLTIRGERRVSITELLFGGSRE